MAVKHRHALAKFGFKAFQLPLQLQNHKHGKGSDDMYAHMHTHTHTLTHIHLPTHPVHATKHMVCPTIFKSIDIDLVIKNKNKHDPCP